MDEWKKILNDYENAVTEFIVRDRRQTQANIEFRQDRINDIQMIANMVNRIYNIINVSFIGIQSSTINAMAIEAELNRIGATITKELGVSETDIKPVGSVQDVFTTPTTTKEEHLLKLEEAMLLITSRLIVQAKNLINARLRSLSNEINLASQLQSIEQEQKGKTI